MRPSPAPLLLLPIVAAKGRCSGAAGRDPFLEVEVAV